MVPLDLVPHDPTQTVLSAMHVPSGGLGNCRDEVGGTRVDWKCLEVLVWTSLVQHTEMGEQMLWRAGCCECCSADCPSAGWSPNSILAWPGHVGHVGGAAHRPSRVRTEGRHPISAPHSPRVNKQWAPLLGTPHYESQKSQNTAAPDEGKCCDHNTNAATLDVTHCCPARPCSPPVIPLQRVCRQPTVLGLGSC